MDIQKRILANSLRNKLNFLSLLSHRSKPTNVHTGRSKIPITVNRNSSKKNPKITVATVKKFDIFKHSKMPAISAPGYSDLDGDYTKEGIDNMKTLGAPPNSRNHGGGSKNYKLFCSPSQRKNSKTSKNLMDYLNDVSDEDLSLSTTGEDRLPKRVSFSQILQI